MTARYDTHEQAEAAVRKLQQNGFDMRQLSIGGHVLYFRKCKHYPAQKPFIMSGFCAGLANGCTPSA